MKVVQGQMFVLALNSLGKKKPSALTAQVTVAPGSLHVISLSSVHCDDSLWQKNISIYPQRSQLLSLSSH